MLASSIKHVDMVLVFSIFDIVSMWMQVYYCNTNSFCKLTFFSWINIYPSEFWLKRDEIAHI